MYQHAATEKKRTAVSVGDALTNMLRPERSSLLRREAPATAPPLALQAKLTVSHPGDAYEQEADRTADRVMRMSDAQVRRMCADCGKEEKKGVMRAESGAGPAPVEAPPVVHEVIGGAGSPLDSDARSFMEPRFGHDFGSVRVHTDARAAESARAVNARAYTVGSHVVFGAGEYDPSGSGGRHLLAHELTHVVQQGASHGVQRQLAGDDIAKGTCPVKKEGTVSEVSWGETSGLYPSSADKYAPEKWDPDKTCELLRARGAIHEVGKRGEKVHKAKPGNGGVEKILKPYHFIENFLPLDSEISDAGVKWFYLSPKSELNTHPTMSTLKWVKKYGPFYNIGGGDVARGNAYIHFYKK